MGDRLFALFGWFVAVILASFATGAGLGIIFGFASFGILALLYGLILGGFILWVGWTVAPSIWRDAAEYWKKGR